MNYPPLETAGTQVDLDSRLLHQKKPPYLSTANCRFPKDGELEHHELNERGGFAFGLLGTAASELRSHQGDPIKDMVALVLLQMSMMDHSC
jgi:hypothetical protein